MFPSPLPFHISKMQYHHSSHLLKFCLNNDSLKAVFAIFTLSSSIRNKKLNHLFWTLTNCYSNSKVCRPKDHCWSNFSSGKSNLRNRCWWEKDRAKMLSYRFVSEMFQPEPTENNVIFIKFATLSKKINIPYNFQLTNLLKINGSFLKTSKTYLHWYKSQIIKVLTQDSGV